jgi:hypothetical protein
MGNVSGDRYGEYCAFIDGTARRHDEGACWEKSVRISFGKDVPIFMFSSLSTLEDGGVDRELISVAKKILVGRERLITRSPLSAWHAAKFFYENGVLTHPEEKETESTQLVLDDIARDDYSLTLERSDQLRSRVLSPDQHSGLLMSIYQNNLQGRHRRIVQKAIASCARVSPDVAYNTGELVEEHHGTPELREMAAQAIALHNPEKGYVIGGSKGDDVLVESSGESLLRRSSTSAFYLAEKNGDVEFMKRATLQVSKDRSPFYAYLIAKGNPDVLDELGTRLYNSGRLSLYAALVSGETLGDQKLVRDTKREMGIPERPLLRPLVAVSATAVLLVATIWGPEIIAKYFP